MFALLSASGLNIANASEQNATELNINGVSDYAATGEQVTSITQFSDVYPTDWAYQALSNLIERYGCVAGYPNGTYRGNRAM
ncbi:MAG: S-layer homology domain-containing protein, partial [Synechococcus sp. cluster2_bin.235]|nr:S-layer homology domain-containing protein [Synechococcus sp. cluster2_bin.235]